MKKRILYLSSFILMVLGVGIFIDQALFKPTEINSFIATKIYSSPANKAFTDDNFYKCVVDAYNSENKTSLPYTTNLSDEQLKSIERVWCGKQEISSASGIDKITNLKYLYVQNNQLTSLDVSKNIKLIDLYVNSNQLTNLNVNNNINLKRLNVGFNKLTTLDVSKNTLLERLEVQSYSTVLNSLDISRNTKLKYLDVMQNEFTYLDFSNNLELETLKVESNKFTILNLSNLVKLKHLDVFQNQLTSLNLSENIELSYLSVSSNKLSTLNLSKNIGLTYLAASNNQLTELDVSKNIALTELRASDNRLTSLDVSKNTSLKYLVVYNNQLTNLDISKNVELTELLVYQNSFVKNIGVYKGIEKSFNNINDGLIKLPNDQKASLIKISSNNKAVNINSDVVVFNELGNYSLVAEYTHNLANQNFNIISGIYNVNVIEATSSKYIINTNACYIYTGADVDPNVILENININAGTKEIIDDKLIIKYNGEVVKKFDIIGISSSKYNLIKDYFYLGVKNFDVSDIIVTNGTVVVSGNEVQIKYGNTVLKTFKIVNISSTKYDLSKEYIFDNNFSINNIKVINGTSEVNNSELLIKYEDVVLSKYKLVSYNSTKYDLSKDSIKVLDNNIEEFINNIKCINCNVKIFDGNEYKVNGDFGDNDKLRILYGDEVLKEYSLTYGVNGISLVNKKVKLNLDTRNSIKLEYTISPKNADNKEVTWKSSNTDVVTIDNNGVITAKGYGDAVITVTTVDGNYSDTCDVNVSEYVDFISPLYVDDKYIYNVKLNTGVNDLLSLINTSGNVSILNNENVKNGNDLVGTGYTVVVKFKNETKKYKVIVKGDVTGTGTSSVSDVAKLYQYLKKKINMEDYFIEAGNVVNTDNEIRINDVAKLYQFIKGKLNSLE